MLGVWDEVHKVSFLFGNDYFILMWEFSCKIAMLCLRIGRYIMQ